MVMKKAFLVLIAICAVLVVVVSCQKNEATPTFNSTSVTSLTASASVSTVAVSSADSLTAAIKFTWNDPKFAVGLSQSKFTFYFSPTGTNFASFSTISVTGVVTESLTGKQLNTAALKAGGTIGKTITLDVKIIASFLNNDEQITSNVMQLTVTPYGDLDLTASATTVVTTAANASATALTLSWNTGFKGYQGAISYQLQYAKGGTSFATPIRVAPTGSTQTFTDLDLNNIAALDYGVPAGSVGTVDFRIKATNAAADSIFSNTATISITPYSSKPVPKFPVPAALFITGDAVTGWNNPVPSPSQQLTQINSYTYGIVIQLASTGGFIFLPVNGDWSHKYNPPSNPASLTGGTFAPDAGGTNVPAPPTAGLYKIVLDFSTAQYSLTLLTSNPLPDSLYIVGDATAGSWNNPVPVPSQRFTQVSNGDFQLTLPLLGTGSYLFLPVNGDWSNKYGGTSATGGALLYDNAVPGSNTPNPGTAGNYLIDVNTLANTYTVTAKP